MKTIEIVKKKMEESIRIAAEVVNSAKISCGPSSTAAVAIIATKIYDEIKDL